MVSREAWENIFHRRVQFGLVLAAFQGLDAAYAEDVLLIVTNLVYALMGRFAAGQLPLTEIRPTIERVLRRLTADVAAPAPDRHGSLPRTSTEQ